MPIAYVGECVGELSVFDGQNPRTLVCSDVLVISRETLWSIVEHSHPVSCNVLRILAKRVRSGNEAVNASQRLQKELEKDANVDPLTGLFNWSLVKCLL